MYISSCSCVHEFIYGIKLELKFLWHLDLHFPRYYQWFSKVVIPVYIFISVTWLCLTLYILTKTWHIQGLSLVFFLLLYLPVNMKKSPEVENLMLLSSLWICLFIYFVYFLFSSVFLLISSNIYICQRLIICQFYILQIFLLIVTYFFNSFAFDMQLFKLFKLIHIFPLLFIFSWCIKKEKLYSYAKVIKIFSCIFW